MMALLEGIIAYFSAKTEYGTDSRGGPVIVQDVGTGRRNALIMTAIRLFLIWLMNQLFSKHLGKVTIQKGFKYYLGWQHILCWTGDNIGLKKIWMNVYDSDAESSTQRGVWDNNSDIAWKSQNQQGLVAHIDDDQMFGGWDEGGTIDL